MTTVRLTVNGTSHVLEAIDPSTPLLWALRDHLGYTGTKYGCGIAQCGACTVHLKGRAVRSCSLPVGQLDGAEVVTIEGLGSPVERQLQDAWVALNVSQCGYCQSGMLMAAADLLRNNPSPSDEDIDRHMTNICRCGTYPRVRQAIRRVADQRQGG